MTVTALVCVLIWILVTSSLSSRREVVEGGRPHAGHLMYWNWVTVRELGPMVIYEKEKYYHGVMAKGGIARFIVRGNKYAEGLEYA